MTVKRSMPNTEPEVSLFSNVWTCSSTSCEGAHDLSLCLSHPIIVDAFMSVIRERPEVSDDIASSDTIAQVRR